MYTYSAKVNLSYAFSVFFLYASGVLLQIHNIFAFRSKAASGYLLNFIFHDHGLLLLILYCFDLNEKWIVLSS